MKEKIGNIILDKTDYCGEDLYCDGTVEDELLNIVQNHSSDEYDKIIEAKRSWPVFYHLSKQRTNIIEWLPISKTEKVLEIGSGCGAITGKLSEKAEQVTCIELSEKRSLINAYRNQDKDNISILLGNFEDVEKHIKEKYDWIMLIGVFEYSQLYINTGDPFVDFLKIIKKHLANQGKVVIAIENKFGLKYWAGCQEDHIDSYFGGLEGYSEDNTVKTFIKMELEAMVRKAGYRTNKFFYPYPDYKFPTAIYSDEYLPQVGELSNNIRNFDKDRIVLFDENKVYRTIINNGLFPLFSNSYLMILQME